LSRAFREGQGLWPYQQRDLGKVGIRHWANQEAIALRGSHISSDEGYGEDMYWCGRSLLKELSHNLRTQSHEEWEKSACQAAEHGPEGIRRLLLSAVDPGVTVTQKIPLDNLCSLLAGLLNPNLDARLYAKAALLHGACTKPVPPSHEYIALFGGLGQEKPLGIEMPGWP
jgi:hypothetical protein